MWEMFLDKIGGLEVINEKMDIINYKRAIKSFRIMKVFISIFNSGFSQVEEEYIVVINDI